MQSIGDFFKVFFLFFLVKFRLLKEEKNVKRFFYLNPAFRKCDQFLLSHYRLSNPYRTVKKHYLAQDLPNPHQYGETPLTTLEKIAAYCQLTSADTIFDLGCGRGRGVFFLSHLLNCSAHGIEWVPQFISIANEVKKRFSLSKISFSCENMLEADLRRATVIYLYGICLEESSVCILIKSLRKMASRTKIITVSYPLTDYADPRLFSLTKSFNTRFPWGEAEIFLQILN
jgi:hypothetical protein